MPNLMERKGLSTRKCGFIVHPTMGWLGASLDAHITDPQSDFPNDIAEFKCPFSKKEVQHHKKDVMIQIFIVFAIMVYI